MWSQTWPTMRAVDDGDPRAPRIRRRQLAAHPRRAPLHERVVRLRRRLAPGAKLPSELGQRSRIGGRRASDLGHSGCDSVRRKTDAARMTSSDHSWPPSNASGRTVAPASRRRRTSLSNLSAVYHSSRSPRQTSADRHTGERGGVQLGRDVAADGDHAVHRAAMRRPPRETSSPRPARTRRARRGARRAIRARPRP